jgi:hypothetical protein
MKIHDRMMKRLISEDFSKDDVVYISTENWNIMFDGNRSLKRYPSDDYIKKLKPFYVNKILGKVTDVYENGTIDVKFNELTFGLKNEFVTKLKEGEKSPSPEKSKDVDNVIENYTPIVEKEKRNLQRIFMVSIKNLEDGLKAFKIAEQIGYMDTKKMFATYGRGHNTPELFTDLALKSYGNYKEGAAIFFYDDDLPKYGHVDINEKYGRVFTVKEFSQFVRPKGRFDREMVIESKTDNIKKFENSVEIPYHDINGEKLKVGDNVKISVEYFDWLKDVTNKNYIHEERWTKQVEKIKSLMSKVGKITLFTKDGKTIISTFGQIELDLNVMCYVKYKPKGRFDREMVVEAVERKFKVGDRVKFKGFDYKGIPEIKGTIAVVRDNYDLGIKFDNYDDGHNLNGFLTGEESNSGWWVSPRDEDLELLRKSTGRFDREMVVESIKGKFKIGDKVKYIGKVYDDRFNKNDIGIIKGFYEIIDNNIYGVEWNRYIKGHDCSACVDNKGKRIRVKEGHGWNIHELELELARPKNRFDKEMVVESLDKLGDEIKKIIAKMQKEGKVKPEEIADRVQKALKLDLTKDEIMAKYVRTSGGQYDSQL